MSKEKENSKGKGGIILTPLEEVMPASMLPYAEYVILDRALPRVEDGLKPVQRRILYSMYDMGLTPDKPHKKSARIVGDCMGKYHPHGDSSVYDAMVRMAQDFNMRMTLVDGHGNFGSVDGDSAAAMRYTEARLEPLALELLRDIEKGTVRFNLNFDDSLKEPATLPGRFPNLLVNGAYGIAVGLATNIPPHNLGEVIDGVIAYIDNPEIDLHSLMTYIPAPDFPTGGFIVANELVQAYETGKGKITMRAKVSLEQADNEKINIVITELPYQVNKASLLKKIADLREEKKEQLAGIYEICDESDRKGMRAVVKLKKEADGDKILELLFKYTDLESSFAINMVVIADGKPKQLGLKEIIRHYVDYQQEIVLRRTKFDLNEAKERSHILQGLIIAVTNIDEVIAIIKGANSVSDAREKLMERFALTERQAQAVLDLRLARLTKLEVIKLEEEVKQLKALIKELSEIVESKHKQLEVVKKELKEVKRKYGIERRSIVVTETQEIAMDRFDSIKPATNCVLCYSVDDTIKLISEKNYIVTDKSITERSALKDVLALNIVSKTDMLIYCFTNLGNCHKLTLEGMDIGKWKDKGEKYFKFCSGAQMGERPIAFLESGEVLPTTNLLFYTKDGYVKKTNWSEYDVKKGFFQAIKLKDGDELIGVENEDLGDDITLFFVTSKGMCLSAKTDDIPEQGRISSGVRGINLNEGDTVKLCKQVDGTGSVVVATKNSLFKRVLISQIEPMVRYRKGLKIVDLQDNDLVIFADYASRDYDIALISDEGFVIVSTDRIPLEARATKGKAIRGMKVKFRNVYSLKYLSDVVKEYFN